MSGKIKFADRKEGICAELRRLAKKGQTIYFSELGKKFGIPRQGPWKPVLDEISREEIGKGLPDLTVLVIAKQCGLPGQLAFKATLPPSPEQRKLANTMIEKVFAYYRSKRG